MIQYNTIDGSVKGVPFTFYGSGVVVKNNTIATSASLIAGLTAKNLYVHIRTKTGMRKIKPSWIVFQKGYSPDSMGLNVVKLMFDRPLTSKGYVTVIPIAGKDYQNGVEDAEIYGYDVDPNKLRTLKCSKAKTVIGSDCSMQHPFYLNLFQQNEFMCLNDNGHDVTKIKTNVLSGCPIVSIKSKVALGVITIGERELYSVYSPFSRCHTFLMREEIKPKKGIFSKICGS